MSAMKFNPKQIDEVVRLLGTLTAAAATGAGIGLERPGQITPQETIRLVVACVVLFACALYLRRKE